MHPEGPSGQAPHERGLPKTGQLLGGKYEIVRLLGEGGMAYVFEASHKRLQQRVAIKVLAPEFARDAELVLRFEREARAVAGLRTRHVVRVIDVEETVDHIPYIVMEFLEGRDLDAELEDRTRLPLDEAVDVVLQACAGMIEAHGMGIVHRDLKPANLFLAKERDGNDRVVKVLDFGISKIVGDATKLTSAGAVLGTVLYMSPEQVRAQPSVDTRADIWSLGVILYELIAGRPPWEGSSQQIAGAIVSKNPPDIRKFVSVPETIATVLRTMLERDPERRFATVQEVVASLASFAPASSIGAAIAEQVLSSQSSLRGSSPAQKSTLVLPTHTIPMGSRPNVLEAQMANVTRPVDSSPYSGAGQSGAQSGIPRSSSPSLSATAGGTPTGVARFTSPAGAPSSSRLVLFLAIVLGLLGAVGVGFILLAKLHKTPRPTAVADAASSTAVPSAHARYRTWLRAESRARARAARAARAHRPSRARRRSRRHHRRPARWAERTHPIRRPRARVAKTPAQVLARRRQRPRFSSERAVRATRSASRSESQWLVTTRWS
jgi:eukaryotic-like serine/threonine-protein kinase